MNASRAWGAACLVVWLGGCTELPGETLGTYKVTMTLKENTCGAAAVFSLDKKRYSVELRSADDHRAYWRIPSQTPIQGRYEEPEFEFEFRAVVATAGPDAGANGCRLVQLDQVTGKLITHDDDDQDEELDAGEGDGGEDESDEDDLDAGTDEPDAEELDADTDEPDADELDASEEEEDDASARGDAGTTLEGLHTMTISAEPGTDCSRVAIAPAGAFDRLPCQVRYKLLGVPTKPF